MFNKIEFSDLYKFLTSIGLLFIVGAFIIPWLFLKQDFGTNLTVDDYNGLLSSAQEIVRQKTQIASLIFKLLPIFSGIMLILGITLVVIGLCNWIKKQKILDQSDELDLATKRANLTSLTKTEVLYKAGQEIIEDIGVSTRRIGNTNELTTTYQRTSGDKNGNIDPKKLVPDIDPIKMIPDIVESRKLKDGLIKMENRVFRLIQDRCRFDYSVREQVKIGDKFKFDILLSSYNNKKRQDLLIEVKYMQQRLSMEIIISAHKELELAYSYYQQTTNRNAGYRMIVVYKKNITTTEEIERFLTALDEFINQGDKPNFKIMLIEETMIDNLDIEKLLQNRNNGSHYWGPRKS